MLVVSVIVPRAGSVVRIGAATPSVPPFTLRFDQSMFAIAAQADTD